MRYAKAAESLIETMIAITVIVLATTAALSVLRTSQAGNEVIGQKVIAINLAMESFEALRNLRDTNYLLFASNPDECWDTLDATDATTCSSATHLTDGDYFLTRDFTSDPMFKWHLTELTSTTTEGFMSLYAMDLDGGSDWEGDMYAQSRITSIPSIMFASTANRNIFQRIINITYAASGDSYDATVTIYWEDNGVEKSLSLTRTIAHVY